MKHIKGDLLENPQWDIAFHVANSYKTFGSGIAYSISKLFSEVYDADCAHDWDIHEIMGKFTKAEIVGRGQTFYSIYAMNGIGNDGTPLGRNTSYDALYDGILRMIDDFYVGDKNDEWGENWDLSIGVPKYAGCCRAGGSWDIVEAMLLDIERQHKDAKIEFLVYELENTEIKAESTLPTSD